MNTTKRLIAWELLNALDPHPIATEHELYRIAHVYKEGLTEKERKFLLQRCEVLKEESDKLSKLKDRLQRTLNGRG